MRKKKAVEKGIGTNPNIQVETAGVGPASAAARTAIWLAKGDYDLVINAGIGGGFKEKVELLEVVISSDIVCADLGAETADSFIPVEELGFGSSRIESPQIMQTMKSGVIITKSTVTGTDETALDLLERFPKAVAEGMEGFGVASAAKEYGVPVVEIRSISNYVGKRDRDAGKFLRRWNNLRKQWRFYDENRIFTMSERYIRLSRTHAR